MPSSAPCCTAGGQTNATASRRGKMEVAARPIPSDPKNYERYLALARDAAQRGDLVEAKNLYQ